MDSRAIEAWQTEMCSSSQWPSVGWWHSADWTKGWMSSSSSIIWWRKIRIPRQTSKNDTASLACGHHRQNDYKPIWTWSEPGEAENKAMLLLLHFRCSFWAIHFPKRLNHNNADISAVASRSPKFLDFGANQKRVCNLVILAINLILAQYHGYCGFCVKTST